MKVCVRCKQELPLDQFSPDRRRRDGLYVYCRGCVRSMSKDYRRRNPEKARASHRQWAANNREHANARHRAWYAANRSRARDTTLRKKYGITLEVYNRMLEYQGGRCAGCARTAEELGGHLLHVDHDHATGRVRGLLCQRCNHGLGLLQSDPKVLRRLRAYLEHHPADRIKA